MPYRVPYTTMGCYINQAGVRTLSERRQEFQNVADMDIRSYRETGVDVLAVRPVPLQPVPGHIETSEMEDTGVGEGHRPSDLCGCG